MKEDFPQEAFLSRSRMTTYTETQTHILTIGEVPFRTEKDTSMRKMFLSYYIEVTCGLRMKCCLEFLDVSARVCPPALQYHK